MWTSLTGGCCIYEWSSNPDVHTSPPRPHTQTGTTPGLLEVFQKCNGTLEVWNLQCRCVMTSIHCAPFD